MDIFGPLLELVMSLSFRGRKTYSERRLATPLLDVRQHRRLLALAAFSSPLLIRRRDLAQFGPWRERPELQFLRKRGPTASTAVVGELQLDDSACVAVVLDRSLTLLMCNGTEAADSDPPTSPPAVLHTPHLSHTPWPTLKSFLSFNSIGKNVEMRNKTWRRGVCPDLSQATHACTLEHTRKRAHFQRGLHFRFLVNSGTSVFLTLLQLFFSRLFSSPHLQNAEQRKRWWGVRGAICSPDWVCILLILINLRNRQREKSWRGCLCKLKKTGPKKKYHVTTSCH